MRCKDDEVRVVTIRAGERCAWLPILLLFTLTDPARAGAIYKCTDAGGGVAYQDVPCAEKQLARVIELEPPPPYARSPEYAIERGAPERPAKARSRGGGRAPASFECRSSDGQVFYRHGGCPHSIAAAAGTTGRRGKSGSGAVKVSARRVSREEACAQIHRAGAIGRSGHEHDEDVTTYERNLGEDPCE